jgi:hypothetical protein
MDLHHVGVVDARRRLRFVAKGLQEGGIVAQPLVHHLDGDFAVKRFVVRAVCGAHAARAQQLDQQKIAQTRRHGKNRLAGGAGKGRKRLFTGNVHRRAASRTRKRADGIGQ